MAAREMALRMPAMSMFFFMVLMFSSESNVIYEVLLE